MAQIDVNGFNLEYEWHGDRTDPPVIGITGFTNQLICWPANLIEGITNADYSFIVFDARDTGLSSRFEDAGSPDISGVLDGTATYDLPYTLDDMARDTIGLMDALQIDKAHVLGYSTGGYKACLAALEAPERISSVTSLLSSAYNPTLPLGDEDVIQASIDICFPMKNREDCIRRVGDLLSFFNGPKYGFTLNEQRQKIGARYDRAWYADGIARHALAIVTRTPRNDEFANITQPTLLVQGTDDCFFSMDHTEDLASRLPNAKLEIIEGAGHAFTDAMAELILPSITSHLNAAGASPAAVRR